MNDNYDDAFDSRKFAGDEMRNALNDALSSLGSTWREVIFEDMARSGMRFDSDARYSINDIRPHVYAAFEEEMGNVILSKVRRALEPPH